MKRSGSKRINKQTFKHAEGKCRICGEPDYNLLDVHRINGGANGGKYSKSNSVSLCVKCHRRTHTGELTIDRYYESTTGRKLRIIEDGIERFV